MMSIRRNEWRRTATSTESPWMSNALILWYLWSAGPGGSEIGTDVQMEGIGTAERPMA